MSVRVSVPFNNLSMLVQQWDTSHQKASIIAVQQRDGNRASPSKGRPVRNGDVPIFRKW